MKQLQPSPHPSGSFESQLRRGIWVLCLLSAFASLACFTALDYTRHATRGEWETEQTAESVTRQPDQLEAFLSDIVASLLVAAALAIVGWWSLRPFLNHTMRPAYALAEAMEEVSRTGKLDTRIPESNKDCVLGHVARCFESMVAKLRCRDAEIRMHHQALEATIAERTKSLHEALDAKDRFLAHMTHELRSPLNSVLGFSELIESGVQGPVTPDQLESLSHIREAGKHLLSLINDILDLAKSQAGEHTLHLESVDLQFVAQEAIQLIEPQARKKHQSVHFEHQNKLPRVTGDTRRIRQILINLLTNAVKFTPKGKALGLNISASGNGENVSLCVWDKGRGISKSDQQFLFKPFFQAAGSGSRIAGTGIGLALSRSLAQMHGGDIQVRSEVGKGSIFEVILPACRSTDGKQRVDCSSKA